MEIEGQRRATLNSPRSLPCQVKTLVRVVLSILALRLLAMANAQNATRPTRGPITPPTRPPSTDRPSRVRSPRGAQCGGLGACFDFPSRCRSCSFSGARRRNGAPNMDARRRNGAPNQDARRERHRTSSQGAHRRHGEADEGTCTPTRSALIAPGLYFAKLRKLPSQTCPPRDLRSPARGAMRAFRRLRLQKAVQSISFSFHNFAPSLQRCPATTASPASAH